MDIFVGVLIGLFVLVVLIVMHELGHALAARRAGVVVEEFGIGFPPRAWGRKLKRGFLKGTLLSINWLPLGGFVKLQGENDAAKKKGDYGAATFWQKTQIMFAGVLMNWLVAIVLLSGLALYGIPKLLPDQFYVPADATIVAGPVTIGAVSPDMPAAQAGLQSGDEIVQFAGEPITSVQELIDVSQQQRGKQVEVVYVRDGAQATVQPTLRDDTGAVFGASLAQEERIRSTWSAPLVGVVTTAQFSWLTLQGIGQLLGDLASGLFMQLSTDPSTRQQGAENLDEVSGSVAGPVGILGSIFPAAGASGLDAVVFLAAIISLTLAVMNILPIPALDGGSWFLMAGFRLFKKPLTKEREEKIKGIGFLVLMGLIILVTIGDVARLIS